MTFLINNLLKYNQMKINCYICRSIVSQNMNLSAATLHVPNGTKALYENAEEWKNFGRIVEYSPTGIEEMITLEDDVTSVLRAYTENGVLYITGLSTGAEWSIYSLAGQLVYKGIAKATEEQVSLHADGVYIVTDGSSAIKVMVNSSY